MFRFRPFAFTEAAALLSIVLRSSICMRPDSRARSYHCLRPFSFSFLPFSSRFFEDVPFSEFIYLITVFSLYGEYVVRFFLPDGVFLPCDHGLDF